MRQEMVRSIITEPLLGKVRKAIDEKREDCSFVVVIALNEYYHNGAAGAMDWVTMWAEAAGAKPTTVSSYVCVRLTVTQILELARVTHDQMRKDKRNAPAVFRIWEDLDVSTTLTSSLVTVKADAAQRSFQARGDGITWAILDSGIQGGHQHFKSGSNLTVTAPVDHCDFTPDGTSSKPTIPTGSALVDRLGHGTHVAGIVAGCWESDAPQQIVGTEIRVDANDSSVYQRDSLRAISGVAPLAKLVSLKVIADVTRTDGDRQTAGQGKVSWILKAIDQIQTWNQNGRRILIHGANMSLGYDFSPRWFACGQSPLCVEINRLVRSGVAVVVSAGNGGYGTFVDANNQVQSRYAELSITDPGNADLAITVGSTHREMPHTYGVSYFSSRGPTGDGRLKPDLLAPGERIISCAAGAEAAKYGTTDDSGATLGPVQYCELTGTSMAAPHVSGAIAAFLSVRHEFIGQPEQVKQIFLDNAIDLRREKVFQGAGLLDLMKVLQAV
jgi:serine protease AprX